MQKIFKYTFISFCLGKETDINIPPDGAAL